MLTVVSHGTYCTQVESRLREYTFPLISLPESLTYVRLSTSLTSAGYRVCTPYMSYMSSFILKCAPGCITPRAGLHVLQTV